MGGCVASRPLPQGDEVYKSKSESGSPRVDRPRASDSARPSSASLNNCVTAKTQSSGQDERAPCCGGGGLDDDSDGVADVLPFFVEAERLASLRSLKIIEQKPESRFDSITSIMKAVFQVPISAITLLEDHTIHFHSRAGNWAKTAPRRGSFCDRILEGAAPRMLVVEDAKADTRFCRNKYVRGKPYIRFYAGAPLVGSTGHRYGTLCIIDFKPRRFTAEQYLMLCHFSELATRELERDRIMHEDQSELKNALRGIKSATGQVLRAMDALNEAVMLTDVSQPEWPVVYCNESWSKATGSDPEIARASSSTSSSTVTNNNGDDDLTVPPLQPLVPFWHMFHGKAVDPSAVATAMAAARLGKAFTLSVRSTVRRGEVINLRFKPVSEPGRLGAAAMPQVAVPAGIGLDWMLQGGTGEGAGTPFDPPRLGRAIEPISPDLTNSKRAELAAALSVLSGHPLAEPQNNSIEKTAAAASATAATVEQQDADNGSGDAIVSSGSGGLLPAPVYYLGVVLNQGPPQPPPRRFPISPFSNFAESEIVAPGIEIDNGENQREENGTDIFNLNGYHNNRMASVGEDLSFPSSSSSSFGNNNGVGHSTGATSSSRHQVPEATQKDMQAAAQLACSAALWDSVGLEGVPQAIRLPNLGAAKTSTGVQSNSGAWGLIDRPPPYLREATLGALIGCGTNSRCYRGVWKQERVAVKVVDMWRESYDPSLGIFTLPLDTLPKHPNLVSVLASAVVTNPTGIPNRSHLEVWTVEEFCNRGQLGDVIEAGQVHGTAYNPCGGGSGSSCARSGSGGGGNNSSSGGSSPRAIATYDLRAILSTAHDIACAMSALHATGTIHGALTSNNVLLTADPADEYRGWKACVSDYVMVAAEAAISEEQKKASTPKSVFGNYGSSKQHSSRSTSGSVHGATANKNNNSNSHQHNHHDHHHTPLQEHPLSKFRGTSLHSVNRPPCAVHIPPDVLLGAPITLSSDVYSFGVLLWEMVSARRAWRTLSPMEVVHAVAVQGCRLPTAIKGVPAPVVDLMEQCLGEEATTRPSFVEIVEMLKVLEQTTL